MKTRTLSLPIIICGAAISLASEFGEVPQWIPWCSRETVEVLAHFGLYGCLGFVVARYLTACLGLRTLVVVLFTADVCGLYGIADEFHQLFVPGRSAQLLDVMTDFVGGGCGAAAYAIWQHLTGGIGTWRNRPELGTAIAIRKAIPVLTALVLVVTPAAFNWGLVVDFFRFQTGYVDARGEPDPWATYGDTAGPCHGAPQPGIRNRSAAERRRNRS